MKQEDALRDLELKAKEVMTPYKDERLSYLSGLIGDGEYEISYLGRGGAMGRSFRYIFLKWGEKRAIVIKDVTEEPTYTFMVFDRKEDGDIGIVGVHSTNLKINMEEMKGEMGSVVMGNPDQEKEDFMAFGIINEALGARSDVEGN